MHAKSILCQLTPQKLRQLTPQKLRQITCTFHLRQLTPQKLRQITCTIHLRQNLLRQSSSASKFTASKIIKM